MNKQRWLWLIVVFLLVNGCQDTSKREALREYIAVVKGRKSNEIEPLLEIKPHKTFYYTAKNLRSPFMPSKLDDGNDKPAGVSGIHPDRNRQKEILERFPLDALKMVGTLEKKGKIWALIADKEGQIYRVSHGNHLGLNHGKIIKITEKKILVEEIIPDIKGGWQKNPIEMILSAPE